MTGDRFVGRTAELAQLRSLASSAATGDPWLAAVVGPAGIGKSALLRRLVASLQGFVVLRARASRSEADHPYGVVNQLVSSLPPDMACGLPFSADGLVTPVTVSEWLLPFLRRLQSTCAVAVVVDDWQWADRHSVAVLDYAIRRLWSDRVFTVLAFRSHQDGSAELSPEHDHLVASTERVLRLQLDGLSKSDVQDLTQRATGRAYSEEAADQLYRQTHGHPLYVWALLNAMTPQELWQSTDPAAPQVPPSVRQTIQSQLIALPEGSRSLLEALAVLNEPSTLARLGPMADVSDPASVLDPILSTGLITWSPLDPTTPVALRHPLQRNAIYALIPPARRRLLHARAIALVDRTSAWRHRVVAAGPLDPALATELEHFAHEESSAGEYGLAAKHLTWAAALVSARSERDRLLLTAAINVIRAFDIRHALRLEREVLECEPSALRSVALGGIALLRGNLHTARWHLRSAGRATSHAGTGPVAAWCAYGSAALYSLLGDGASAMKAAANALRSPDSPPGCTAGLHVFMAAGTAQQVGLRAAVDYLRRHLPDRRCDMAPTDVDPLMYRGWYRVLLGELTEGASDLATAVRIMQSGPSLASGGRAHAFLSVAQYLCGDWEGALTNAKKAMALHERAERPWDAAPVHMALVLVSAGRGDAEAAASQIKELQAGGNLVPPGQDRLYTAVAVAVEAQARGDHAAMLKAVRSVDRASERQADLWASLWLPLRTEAFLGTGRLAEAQDCVERLGALAQHMPALRSAYAWLSGWLAEAQGLTDGALALYQDTVHCADEAPAGLHRALLMQRYGHLLHSVGRRKKGIAWLERASHAFAALQADPFLERCSAELSEYGLSVSLDIVGTHTFTRREREIALLIGRGLTNVEIAAELFVSSKTVEYHLSQLYRKLGFANRRQLRDHVQRNMP